MVHLDWNSGLLKRIYKKRDEHGRLPHHWLAEKAQTHTHALAMVGVESIGWNPEALTTRDNKGETPLDIARRSGACAEIIGLLSLTPEEADSLSGDEMRRLYAPVAYWMSEMTKWFRSRSWADCHKFINEHNDELVREVLKYDHSHLLLELARKSQIYSESLVFLALRMIHRYPLSLNSLSVAGNTPLRLAGLFDACIEIRNVLSLTPKDISSTPFPTLLRQHLPKQFVDEWERRDNEARERRKLEEARKLQDFQKREEEKLSKTGIEFAWRRKGVLSSLLGKSRSRRKGVLSTRLGKGSSRQKLRRSELQLKRGKWRFWLRARRRK